MPELFEEFRAKVMKFRTDGTRIIRAGRRNVDIGPIKSQVDDKVTAILVSQNKAICTDAKLITSKYSEYINDLSISLLNHAITELPEVVAENISYPPPPYDNIDDISPENGEFVARIDRISISGNGIVETENAHINLGPVKSGSVGSNIVAKLEDSGFARCLTESVKKPDYKARFSKIKNKNKPSHLFSELDKDSICMQCGLLLAAESLPSECSCDCNGETNNKKQTNKNSKKLNKEDKNKKFTAQIDRISDSGNGLIETENGEINIGPVTKDALGTEITARMESNGFARCMTETVRASHYDFKYESLKNQNDSDIPIGKCFTSEVADVDSSQIGCVDAGNEDNIIIGPVSCEEGTEIEVEYLGDGYAYCNDKSVQSNNYYNRLKIIKGNYDSLPIDVGESYTGEIIKSYSDSSIASVNNIHVNLDVSDIDVGKQVKIRITGFATQSAHGEIVEEVTSESRAVSETSQGSSNQTGLYLVPVSDSWRDEFRNSVENPINLNKFDNIPPKLSGENKLRIWATTETDASNKQAAINKLQTGDCILFYHDGEFFAGGTIRRTFESSEVGEMIWNQPESRHIYILDKYTTDVPSITQVWDKIGYEGRKVVQGFSRVADNRLSEIKQQFCSIEAAFIHGSIINDTNNSIENTGDEFETLSDSDPQLTEDQVEYTESRRRARDGAFTQKVRNVHNEQCAICGSERQSPSGNPEVEAAHIHPKKEGGSDDVRNGIALCKLHHWAFDSGWLSLTDNYKILVKDAPNYNGFQEFKTLEGKQINLPEKKQAKPHPKFLKKHRELHNFSID